MSRIDKATRNIKYGYLGLILQLILGFVSRTVFIYTLGITYLGINGLYTNILGVLSLAELGIGTAMNYCLYKPVAERDIETIKSIMQLYKKAYLSIALIVSVLGLSLLPFLNYIIKDPGSISVSELKLYYLIFLFNTVTTYFVAYKYSLVNAEQNNYIQTNIQSLTSLITVILQILSLVIFKNFLLYLLIGAIIGSIQKIAVCIYLNRLYPFLLEKNVVSLPKNLKNLIKNKISALIYFKFGEISLYQTDNIIISTFINVSTVGLLSNYNLLITSASGFIHIIFNSVVSSFGNLIATENTERQYYYFKIYRFIAFWLYGFATVAFWILITPFICLWVGNKMVISDFAIYLILINYYITGHAIVINNIRNASGIFEPFKIWAIILTLTNLIISLLLVKPLGINGVFIGTICASLTSTFSAPIIIYRSVFKTNPIGYYRDSLIYIIPLCLAVASLELIKRYLLSGNTMFSFLTLMFCVAVLPNIIFYIFLKNREEFSYLKATATKKIKSKWLRRCIEIL